MHKESGLELVDLTFELDIDGWQWYKYKDLFTIERGRGPRKKDLGIGGTVPFVTSTDQNNGWTGFTHNTPTHKGNVITVNRNGSVAEAFYQPLPFCSTEDVHVFNPKFSLNPYIALFLCSIIRLERYRYGYGRKWGIARMNESIIKLPSTHKGDPDWHWIEGYIRNLRFSEMLEVNPFDVEDSSQDGHNDLIDLRMWKYFELRQLFDIRKGKRLTKANMTTGSIPFIGSIDSNNGLSTYIGGEPIHAGNTITVNYNGSVAEAFYQESPFWCSDDVNVLYPNFNLNPYIAMFITTIIRREKYRFNYGRKWHLERMGTTKIKLPTNSKSEPDWEWMEGYIKGLPYSSHLTK